MLQNGLGKKIVVIHFISNWMSQFVSSPSLSVPGLALSLSHSPWAKLLFHWLKNLCGL